MADALKPRRFKVEQTLHGYSEGHRLIAGSAKLPQPDARLMLVLSDASGGGGRIPSEGYLTGYPLPTAGKYVLARTWAAPEMGRPGCVWTHSLLVDFADLARLVSPEDLLQNFARPSGGASSAYGVPVDFSVGSATSEVAEGDVERLGQWLEALYGHPRSRIAAERTGTGDDALVLAVWMQQWPRLRRAFRFCTQVVDDRSNGTDIFDLQLIDGGRSGHRSRLSNAVLASTVTTSGRVASLVEDMLRPGRSELRSFLREVGGDVSGGRAVMLPLVSLFEALDPSAEPAKVVGAISAVEELGASQAGLARAAAARLLFSRPDAMDDALATFAFEQVASSKDLLGIDPGHIGRALLEWRPDGLASALTEGGALRTAVEAVLPTINADDLASALSRNPDALVDLIPARPDLLESPALWRTGLSSPVLLGAANPSAERATAVIMAMMDAGRADGAEAAVRQLGARPVIRALGECIDSRPDDAWFRVVASRPEELAACMADGTLRNRRVLLALCYMLDPDTVPNAIGEDPWVTAVHQSLPSGDRADEDMLAAFLFCRALGWTSRSQGRLFFLSVQRLHEASAMDRLHGAARHLTERRLPFVLSWREWDRCERIRKAVVDHFVDRDLPPLEFGTVVDDGKLWSKFVDFAADSGRGTRYLDRVRRSLREGPDQWWHDRAKIIDRKIR